MAQSTPPTMSNVKLLSILVAVGLIAAAGAPALAGQLQISNTAAQAGNMPAGNVPAEHTATLHIDGNVSANETVDVTATFGGDALAGADIEVNDQFVGETDADGTLTGVEIPDTQSVDFDVESDRVDFSLELEDGPLQQAATAGQTNASLAVDGNLTAGENVDVTAHLFDDPMSSAVVEVDGDEVETTNDTGMASVVVPAGDEFDVEVQSMDAKLELKLEKAPEPPADAPADAPEIPQFGDSFNLVLTDETGAEILNETIDTGADFEFEFESEDDETETEFEVEQEDGE
ncbi:MAG: hypothetical protein ACI8XM_001991, partial [Haloarculaceae archaeon]